MCARRWEAQWADMQAAARIHAAAMRNDFVAETAERQGRTARGCFCPNCGQVNHKLGERGVGVRIRARVG